MNSVLLYHYWNDDARPPHLNLQVPVVHSIATLRAVNQDLKVIVLDGSDRPQDYHGWDRRLNFQVVPISFSLSGCKDKAGWRNLSRLFDIQAFWHKIQEGTVIYADADVFWLKDPLPLAKDPARFCFNKYNSGFFYFDKNSPEVQWFFELFKAYTLTALNDDNFRVITRQYTDYKEWYYVLDETILYYMYVKMPNRFNVVDIYEHLTPCGDFDNVFEIDIPRLKMVHCHDMIMENPYEEEKWRRAHNRGLAPLIYKEVYANLMRAVGENGARELYPKEFGKFKQVNIGDPNFIARLIETRNERGHYNLTGATQ